MTATRVRSWLRCLCLDSRTRALLATDTDGDTDDPRTRD